VAGHAVTGEELDGVTLARKHLGYCPQVDPLLERMTARETLLMFGKLRGIPIHLLDSLVEELLQRLTLINHSNKESESLSGGNKRKLSLGIALVGNPRVLLIDEASSGLDPVAKRQMWNLISEVSKDRSVIVTTHSMEEAEALCTRAVIMAQGRFLCLGSVQHLKVSTDGTSA
jgi:ATP-binding cassette, subfamily A (ABC1), member 3